MAIINNVMVKWLGGGISEQVIPVSSPVSRNAGVISFQKVSISYNPYQARSSL